MLWIQMLLDKITSVWFRVAMISLTIYQFHDATVSKTNHRHNERSQSKKQTVTNIISAEQFVFGGWVNCCIYHECLLIQMVTKNLIICCCNVGFKHNNCVKP